MRSRLLVSALGLGLVVSLATPAGAVLPYGQAPPPGPGGVYDYGKYLFLTDGNCNPKSAQLPANFDCEHWEYTDYREDNAPPPSQDYDPAVSNNPQELYGVRGPGTNRAWEVSTGRPDVVIAVMDSGIRWEEAGRDNLLRKHFLNRGELPVPEGGPNSADRVFGGYDVNGDGFFNVVDYAGDSRVSDLNGNGVIDPEDLIRIFSDSVDRDNNGYVDDISGWDFFENDNDPQDEVDYSHGTGEAGDSSGEAGLSGDGQCPNCMVMSLRVGDSFVADVNHWAEAVVYSVDNGVGVVQEALGTLNHTSFGQAAADYAYENGVIINASEADEAAGHHNWPAAYEHTMVVNSIRTSGAEPVLRPNSYLYFNGCTNFGSYTYVSIPSTNCSSEATGRSAGISGLLRSAAMNAVDDGRMTNYLWDNGSQADFPLSAEEMMQLWRLAADDIDFSSDCTDIPGPLSPGADVHDFCNDAPADVPPFPAGYPTANNYGTGIPATARYQSVKGWDYFFGYGRANNARLLRFIGRDGAKEYVPGGPYGVGDSPLTAQDRIPPEADISYPPRWRQYGYDASGDLLLPDDPADPDAIVVRGRVAANRVTAGGGTFDWVLEWAPQVQGQKDPVSRPAGGSEELSDGPWTSVAASACSKPLAGMTSAYEGELCRIDAGDLASALSTNPSPFDPATDPTSEFLPERFAIRLRLRVIAHPKDAADTVNNEAVTQKQIDVYPTEDVVEGQNEDLLRYDIGLDGQPAGGGGAPSFHDLDGDGVDELLLPTEDGIVHAYTNPVTGDELPGWPVMTRQYPGWRDSGDNAYMRGDLETDDARASILLGSLAAADLDDDGDLEVSIADLEGHLYVWEPDGTLRSGFPVTVDPALSKEPPCQEVRPACDDYSTVVPTQPGQGIRDELNDRDWGINSAPAIGDLDPGTPGLEIVVGANDGHVYAWHEDGSAVAGWPVFLRDPAKVEEMDPTTRHVVYTDGSGAKRGVKVLVSPSIGDVEADGDPEVVIGVNEEYVEDPNADLAGNPLFPVVKGIGEEPGNTRMYVLHNDGTAHPDTPASAATSHVHDQAYVEGWPVPLALLLTDLLPYVAEGTNSQAVLANIPVGSDTDPNLEIVVASAAGPGYILNDDGSSFLGETPDGKYNTLAGDPFGPGSTSTDEPSLIAVGALAIGSLDGGRHLTIAGPGAGAQRALDIIVPEQQVDAEDHLLGWNASTGEFEVNFPITVNDLQFFISPIVADIDADGLAEIITGTAVSDLVAAGLGDTNLTAERYFTGGWGVTAAGLGAVAPGSGLGDSLQLAQVTREGWLRLFPTEVEAGSDAACTALSQWPEYGHDAFNSGNYHTDGERPYPVTQLVATANGDGVVTLTFLATGDDRACGKAERYRARILSGLHTDPAWEDGTNETTSRTNTESGVPDRFTIGPLAPGSYTIMVRADDDAGNGSAIASTQITITAGPTPGPGPSPDGVVQVAGEGGSATGPVAPSCPGLKSIPGIHVVGTAGDDILVGTPGRDVICGLGGDDELRGLGGEDLIIGAGGDDVIAGGTGSDTVRAGGGGDLVRGGRQNDLLRGGADADHLRGGPNDDTLHGGPGADACAGGGGTNDLHGCES